MSEFDWKNPDSIAPGSDLTAFAPEHVTRGDFWSEPFSFSEAEVLAAGDVGITITDPLEMPRLLKVFGCDIPAGATVEKIKIVGRDNTLKAEAFYEAGEEYGGSSYEWDHDIVNSPDFGQLPN